MNNTLCIGVMSGTSLDGVDIALCSFNSLDDVYSFELISSQCYSYPIETKKKLENAPRLNGLELTLLHIEYGEFLAELINQFVDEFDLYKSQITFIASHGYTVFHQPNEGLTLQIGCGQSIATLTGVKTISDFRTKDVLNGGQGAPLVPIGDQYLFSQETDACLNLGGFANISILNSNEIIAFDISPANLPLNQIVNQIGFEYDENGRLGREGKVNDELLQRLNSLAYYEKEAPKSLGTEWLKDEFYTEFKNNEKNLTTIYEHIAFQVAEVLKKHQIEKVLITGGGAFNSYLMERIIELSKVSLVTVDKKIVEFKEAIVFAFLGLRFQEGKFNCLSKVTGASLNVVGGVLHKP